MSCVGGEHVFIGRKVAGIYCMCRETRLCNQCWRAKPVGMFSFEKSRNCAECRERAKDRRKGERLTGIRRGLPTDGDARYLFIERSGNKKLGPIPAVTASGESCPPSCSWYGQGCYAEFGPQGKHWRSTGRDGISFDALLVRVSCLPRGQLWRYAVAGDLPGRGDELDVPGLRLLALANREAGARGFTFTHKPLRTIEEQAAVATANAIGFAVNLSADSPEDADRLAELGVAPVAVVLPSDAVGDVRTPAGRRVVVCPAELRGISCSSCGLCAKPGRKGIVGFRAHGQMAARVSEVSRRSLPVVAGA